jgi:hypothetical protein
LSIVARAKYLRYDVQLIDVMLGGLGQLRCDVELLVLKVRRCIACAAFSSFIRKFSTTNT